jgi:hypothetical protein
VSFLESAKAQFGRVDTLYAVEQYPTEYTMGPMSGPRPASSTPRTMCAVSVEGFNAVNSAGMSESNV